MNIDMDMDEAMEMDMGMGMDEDMEIDMGMGHMRATPISNTLDCYIMTWWVSLL